MLFLRGETISRIVITISIGFVSWIGDSLLFSIKDPTIRAISDNLTHALVGGLSWTLIIKLSKKPIARNVLGIILCFFVSSLIDLDHFLLAKSWKLRDALHLGSKRPIFHCSLIPLFLWLIFEIFYKIFHTQDSTSSHYYYYYCWLIITAFFSHHIRDANRRGLWFGFFGSTPSIPYYFYLIFSMGLPYFLQWLMPSDDVIKDQQALSLIQSV